MINRKLGESHKLFNNLKSQGLSLNTIIIAAIVLIVLIVLWAIFTGRIGLFSEELQECKGTCELKKDCLALSSEGHDSCSNTDITEGEEITTYTIPQSEDDREYCCLVKK